MPLGDSITDGYGIRGGYRIELYRDLKKRGIVFDFVGSLRNGPASLPDKDHEGHIGWRIDQIQTTVDGWIRTYRPDFVLLLIGTNDILRSYRVATAPTRLDALVGQIYAVRPATKIVVSTIPPTNNVLFNREVAEYNAAIRRVVQRRAAAGRSIWLVNGGGRLTSADLADGVHPNRTGYRKLADAWQVALVRVLSPRKAASLLATTLQPTLWAWSSPLSRHDALTLGTRR